ncbi:MAG: hypothetical protein HY267_05350 [Deltaproteobacteria bacterium]|nr:hypothetical protein [Deltaproteobacteria bacterium]
MNTLKPYSRAARTAFAITLLLSTSGIALAEETNGVLAKVGDHTITEKDISDEIAGQMVRINNQIYATKKQAVDSAVADYLINQEAQKRSVTREQLLKQEVADKTPAVTDEEVQQIFDANKARLGDKKLDDVKPQIVQQLQANKQQQRQQDFIQELKKAAAVKLFLKPPVLNVSTEGAPVRGSANAPVMIVEFSDFQ